MFIDEDEDLMTKVLYLSIQFYTDAINSAVFDTPISYLGKYPIEDYAIIVQT